MNVSSWSIKNPIPAVIVFILLSLAGLVGFRTMKVQQFPDLDLPTITVSASLQGASPAQLENEVARKLENSIAKLQGIKHIYTKLQDGSVVITAEFRLEKQTQEALDEVRSAVQEVRADLPQDLRDPIVNKVNLSASPILAYTISDHTKDEQALSWFVDDTLARKLTSINGVGSVSRVGGVSRQVWVELDTAKLQSLNLTAAQVSTQLKLNQLELSGGVAKLGQREQPIRTIATVKSAQALGQMEIALTDGRKVWLNQVATIKDTVAEPTSAAFLNGKSVVGFDVTRTKGASELEVGAAVREALKEIQLANPQIEITEAFDFVTPVKEDFDASLHLLIEGALLAVIVVWFFLKDTRATVVSAVALPLSIIPAFIGMQYFGFTINVVTLLALSLVVGVLVDDAIVEVENIARHIRMGKTPYQAAMEAADEIGLAVIATTFTLIAVFLPTAFMSGIPGKFFKQFGWTASFAVFASLLVARMLTPMMAAYMMKPTQHQEQDGVIMRVYLAMVHWVNRHRIITVILAVIFFVGSLMLMQKLPQGFVPSDDNSQTQVRIELAPGATLNETIATAEQARLLLMQVKNVNSVYTTIGGGAAGSDPFVSSGATETRNATLTITLDERGQRPVKQVVEQEIRTVMQNLAGARITVGLGGNGERYILVLTGDNGLVLEQAASAIQRELRTIPGLGNIASSAALVRPEVLVTPNLAAAADLGVSTSAIAETLRVATVGDYEQALSKINLDKRQVAVLVKLSDVARTDLATLEKLSVIGSKGPVPLGQVAHLELSSGPSVIDRFDRERNIQLTIELSGQPLGEVTRAVNDLPSVKHLPAGVSQRELGDAEAMTELFQSFGLAMLTGVLCIYFVLVLLFKDFLQPVTILMALPLSIGGAVLGLLVANKALSMPSMIGLVMLMGISTKNSILLVEYAIVARRDRGLNRLDALIDACHKRARPIVMTTIAMVAGMVPIAMEWGSGDGSFRSPMGAAVVGGLITSTVFSLLVIPVVFTYVDDFSRWILRVTGWRKAH